MTEGKKQQCSDELEIGVDIAFVAAAEFYVGELKHDKRDEEQYAAGRAEFVHQEGPEELPHDRKSALRAG